MSDNIVSVSDGTFDEEVLKSDVPVLVDYWAEWCGPCKMIAPILEEISGDYSGRLKIAKINIDENPGTPPKYGIRGIPTLMLFKNGSVEATKVGALSKSQLTAFIGAWDRLLPIVYQSLHGCALLAPASPPQKFSQQFRAGYGFSVPCRK